MSQFRGPEVRDVGEGRLVSSKGDGESFPCPSLVSRGFWEPHHHLCLRLHTGVPVCVPAPKCRFYSDAVLSDLGPPSCRMTLSSSLTVPAMNLFPNQVPSGSVLRVRTATYEFVGNRVLLHNRLEITRYLFQRESARA